MWTACALSALQVANTCINLCNRALHPGLQHRLPDGTHPMPAGPYTRHLARKFGAPDGQDTLGTHAPPRSLYAALQTCCSGALVLW